ncbi:hypothetical protein D9M68_612400 [compost metagenome]
MRQTRQIDLFHHVLQALVDVSDQIRQRPLQPDFPTGHRAGAQLVFETHDAIGIAAAVVQAAWHREQRQSARTLRRAFRTGQQQGDVRIRVGAEPLLSMQPPLPVGLARDGFQGADI